MSKYARDLKAIREADATKAILTCHDEYLLASMVQGVDGALVGFASFIPQLIIDLYAAVKKGDLHEAMRIQGIITPLKEAVYGGGEPTGEAHARMKTAMKCAGVIANDYGACADAPAFAREEEAEIQRAVQQAGLEALSARPTSSTGDKHHAQETCNRRFTLRAGCAAWPRPPRCWPRPAWPGRRPIPANRCA
jgi:dihydrodipicolinate synthase/N-acetylneuraminate lyase